MTADDIAKKLLALCSFKHADGRPYKDDALDTWAFLYAGEYPVPWDEVERALIALKGENYHIRGENGE